jgi:CRISPR-associated protein Cas2
MIYLYIYNIADSRRRAGISTKLAQFGVRLQKSVFRCDISAELAETLKSALIRLLDEKEDSLYIVPLCEKDLEKAEWFGPQVQQDYAGGAYNIL